MDSFELYAVVYIGYGVVTFPLQGFRAKNRAEPAAMPQALLLFMGLWRRYEGADENGGVQRHDADHTAAGDHGD